MENKSTHIDLSERRLLLRIVDVTLSILSLWLANSFLEFYYVDFTNANIFSWLILLVVYYLLFAEIFQAFNLDVSNNRFLVTRSIVLTTFVTTIFYILTPFISPEIPENRLQIVYFLLLITIPVLLWRFLYMFLLFTPKYFKSILIVGHSNKVPKLLKLIKNDNFHQIPTYVSDKNIDNDIKFTSVENLDLYELAKKHLINEIVISTSGFSSNTILDINKQIIQLFEEGVNIKSFEKYYEEITNRVPKEYLDHNFYKTINFSNSNDSRLYMFFHRGLDIVISSLGLLAFMVFLPIIFIGNILANKGPLFYTQQRVGKKGKYFKIFKLRSMVVNAEKDGAVWAKKNDARITSFGKFLRNTRLDEVPQFFNILRGDMSLIGPRPERPEFVSDLEEKIPFYAIRHVIRPGLTGWAQVNYPYANTLEEQETKLRYDLYYIKERGAFIDFKILIKTITTVLFFRGQ